MKISENMMLNIWAKTYFNF